MGIGTAAGAVGPSQPAMDVETASKPKRARRREWFAPFEGPFHVLWWIEEGSLPTVAEGVARLARLNTAGSSAHAFGFREIFES